MSKTKKLFTLWLLSIIMMLWCTLWAKVIFQPLYSDARFPPSDILHAGCDDSANISFSPQGQKITKFTLVFYYNPDDIEILRILPNTNNGIMSSKIEYNKVVLEVQNPIFASSAGNTPFFQIYFKSHITGKEAFSLGTGSEAVTATKTNPLQWTFSLDFGKVPECDPDVVPPNISLMYPKNTDDRITLDQYFVFDIKDIGKWVDKSSVIINFDGQEYSYWSENLKRNGDYLTFYPGTWIPINTKTDLKISVKDLQSYGWANKTENTFSFKSATGMSLNKAITPLMFNSIVQGAEKISATSDECSLLMGFFYNKSVITNQQELKSIIQKLWCNLTSLTTSIAAASSWSTNKISPADASSKYRYISVFAITWWVLFFVSFILRLHYFVSYRKHKRIAKNLMK